METAMFAEMLGNLHTILQEAHPRKPTKYLKKVRRNWELNMKRVCTANVFNTWPVMSNNSDYKKIKRKAVPYKPCMRSEREKTQLLIILDLVTRKG
jgi:hypothetical protein